MSDTFEIGEIVQLKSGGPKMTVARIEIVGGEIVCYWFAGAKREFGSFEPATLKRPEQEEPSKK